MVARDDKLATSIGLAIKAAKHFPDIIFVDLKPSQPLIVFVEVVATDGSIGVRLNTALEKLAEDAGFDPKRLAFAHPGFLMVAA